MAHDSSLSRLQVLTEHLVPRAASSGAVFRSSTSARRSNRKSKESPSHVVPSLMLDVVVIGGGVVGSSVALELARRGLRVTLLEQYANGSQSSSLGDGRIIRYAYGEQVYVRMAQLSYPLWRQVEAQTGDTLMHICGGADLWTGEAPPAATALYAQYRGFGIAHETLTPAQLHARCPHVRLAAEQTALWQPEYGVLRANRAVAALWQLAQRAGAAMRGGWRVDQIETSAGGVRVRGPHGALAARGLVVCAGPFAAPLCASLGLALPLSVTREAVSYFAPRADSRVDHRAGNGMPVLISYAPPHIYLLPQLEVGGVKLGVHHAGSGLSAAEVEAYTQQAPDRREPPPGAVDAAAEFVRAHLPHLQPRPFRVEVCLYTNTPDHHFLVDRHPRHDNVIVCSPCSGHGFKFGPLYGKLVASLLFKEQPPVPMDLFRLDRERTVKRETA